MRHRIAEDAKPQLLLLLLATVITLVLWFIPLAEYLVYPIRLFVTFIHESSHALIAVLTGGSVQSLTISMDGSGVVYSAPSSTIGGASDVERRLSRDDRVRRTDVVFNPAFGLAE